MTIEVEKFGYAISGFGVGLGCLGSAAYFTAFTPQFLLGAVCSVILGVSAQILSQTSR